MENLKKDKADKELNKAVVQDDNGQVNAEKVTSGTATAFIFVAVVFSLIAGGATFLLFQSLQDTRTELVQKLEKNRANLSDITIKLNGDVNGQLTTLTDKIGQIKADQQQFQALASNQQQETKDLSKTLLVSNQQMRQSIDVLFKQKGRERIGWVLAEVEYLLLIANHSLKLQNDVPTAIAALQAADSRLLDTGDPGTIESRNKIRDEIQILKALQQPDVVGMAAGLGSVIKGIPSLPIKYTQINTKDKIDALIEKKASHDASDLGQAGKDFLHELRSLVVYRQMDETPKALMTPDQQFFLQQNLQLKIETARRALLMGQQALFTESLNEATQWLREFFDLEVAQVKQTLKQLTSLQGMRISSDIPDISASIKVLRSYQNELERRQEVTQ